ncbi:MAG TPA: hypothetical protein VGP12_08580 [Nitrosospira sp.]|jgi:hypothetical protein|nr:hypothetical protein [Nitrosospira sp.]
MNSNPYQPPHAFEAAAFSRGFRCTVAIFVAAILYSGTQALLILPEGAIAAADLRVKILVAAAIFLLLYTTYWFQAGRIRIDEQGITQTWIFNKRVLWTEVISARLMAVPKAEFLFPPRLIVSSGFGRFKAFNGGEAVIWQEFAQIHLHYRKK